MRTVHAHDRTRQRSFVILRAVSKVMPDMVRNAFPIAFKTARDANVEKELKELMM
jgi:hypothetical protein